LFWCRPKTITADGEIFLCDRICSG
jgi:hypothetical protein